MNLKWFYGTLFVLLAVLGVKMDRQMLSNQEIVVRFTEEGFTQDKAEKAISEVKNQLQDVGVENIHIRELEDGGLKITYYSSLEVSEIKQVLAEANLSTQNSTDSPFEFPSDHSDKDYVAYELNVYEIHGNSQFDIDLDGTPVLEPQVKEQLYIPNTTANTRVLDLSKHYEVSETSLQVHSKSASLRTLYYYTLPEVRAGPMA